MNVRDLFPDMTNSLLGVLAFAAAVAAGFLLSVLAGAVIRTVSRRNQNITLRSVRNRFGRPLFFFFPLVTVAVASGIYGHLFLASVSGPINQLIRILFVAWATWSLAKIFFVIEDLVFHRYRVDIRDNLRARKIRTQTRFMKQLGSAMLAILGFGIILTTFSTVRQVGTTLLASAGVIGVIVGFAAQKALGLVIAGFQVAFTQPIRIEDVVVVEGEWGKIEEITLTYVVVRIWDLRRLVLPINYFIEHPFQNWTRTSADILGTVFLHLDYSVPIPPLREELARLLDTSPLWDRQVCVVQVTDADEKGIEVRFLMSSKDSSDAWDLRCYVREQMIAFIRDRYPGCLPFLRVREQ